jgi:hypothetical protein
MAVDCDAERPGVQSTCAFAGNSVFDVQIHVTQPPDDGYWGFETKLRWDEPPVSYEAAERSSSEGIWQHCDIPARADNRAGEPSDASLLFACVPFPTLMTGSTNTGPVLQFRFQCLEEGDSAVELVPLPGDDQLGSHFWDTETNEVEPTLSGARVACGPCPAAGCTPPVAPLPVPPPPDPTPAPAGSGGMAIDCDAAEPRIQAACDYNTGETFRVEVHVTHAPAVGYGGFDVSFQWTDAPLDYLPADERDEALFAPCDGALRLDYQGAKEQPRLAFTCLSVPWLDPSSTATGAVLRFQFQCVEDGEALLEFVPPEGDPQLGTLFFDESTASIRPSDLVGATVICTSPP